MTIAWIYLDKKAAAIAALKDYIGMQHILMSYLDDVREARANLTAVQTPMLTGTPGAENPHAEEGRILRALDLVDVVQGRYNRALEYMAWFQPAWEALTKEERDVLEAFFMHDGVDRSEVTQRLCEMFNIERSAVYRRKDKASGHLALLLYGK